MHIILTGATGTCGAAVLKHCLATPDVTRLTVLSRRPIAQAVGHPKASVIIHQDFTHYPPSLLEQLKDAEGCIWALGVSQADVSKEEYVKITHDYTLAAAQAFSSLSNPFKFVYVSGEGADPAEKSYTYFGKIKGRTEKDLQALSKTTPSLRAYSVRPAVIDPEGKDLRDQPHALLHRAAVAVLGPVFRFGAKSMVIGTRPLAQVLTDLAMGDGEALQGVGVEAEGWTLRNTGIRAMAGI